MVNDTKWWLKQPFQFISSHITESHHLLIAKILWELRAVVKPHQKEQSNVAFGNGNGVTELKQTNKQTNKQKNYALHY